MLRRFVIAALLPAMAGLVARAEPTAAPTVRTLDQGWRLRLAPGDANAADHPGATRWFAGAAPGSVQTDLMAAHRLADPWKGDNEGSVQWVGLSDWQYATRFSLDAATLARAHDDLVFEGLDTFAKVRLNGVAILAADNMFRSWRVAVKPLLRLGENHLEVDLASPIKALQPRVLALKHPLPGSYDSQFGDEPKGRQTAGYVRKANYQYGWDWAPRVVTLGVWRPVRLESYDGSRLANFHVEQVHLDDDAAVLDAKVEVWSDAPRDAEVRVAIAGPDGATQHLTRQVRLFVGTNPVTLPARIAHPRRWWPTGYGRPDLYTATASVLEGGREIGRDSHAIGLRTVELRRDQDAWGRSFALVVNGVPIFAKGANFLPPDSIPSRVPQARIDALFEAAVQANLNVLRLWGGGYYFDDAVYAKADRLGLMLWQDFGFGGALPPDDAAFHENTRLEAVELVRRLRDHPSLVIWVGNNEVQVSWEKWGDRQAFKATLSPDERESLSGEIRSLFDKDLRAIVALNAPGTPYWAGSPTSDYDGASDQLRDGDVHYWDVWVDKPLETYLTTTPRFLSEFGLQSMPDMRTIEAFMAPANPNAVPAALTNGYDAGKGNARLMQYLRANYGEPRSFADYVYLSQVLQAEGLEMAVIHMRASRPQTMGTLYWTLNDAWPGQINRLWTGAAWGSLDFANRWKALHYHARRFYAPVTIGAQRSEGVTTLTLISDRRDAFAAHWRLRLEDRDGAVLSDRSGDAVAQPLAATPLARLTDAELLGAHDSARTFAVAELTTKDGRIARNFVYFTHAKDMVLDDPQISTDLQPAPGGGYALTLRANSLARAVWIDLGDDAKLSDNAFDMTPGEPVVVHVTSAAPITDLRRGLVVRSLFGAARRLK